MRKCALSVEDAKMRVKCWRCENANFVNNVMKKYKDFKELQKKKIETFLKEIHLWNIIKDFSFFKYKIKLKI